MNAHLVEAPCQLFLLGGFELAHGGRSFTDSLSPRMKELLAFLALHAERPLPRRQVAFALWPETTDGQAQTNLRQLVHRLNQRLPFLNRYLALEGSLAWNMDAGVYVDLLAFARGLEEGEIALRDGEVEKGIEALERAIAVYRGDLLPNCYSEWVAPYRDLWRNRFAAALQVLITSLVERGEYGRAIPYADRLLALDEFHEPSYRLLMQLHAARGDLRAVRDVYMRCVLVLRNELGVAPDAATQALAARYGVAEAGTPRDIAPRPSLELVRAVIAEERARKARLRWGAAQVRAWGDTQPRARLVVTGIVGRYAAMAAENSRLHAEVRALRDSLSRLRGQTNEEVSVDGDTPAQDDQMTEEST